MKSVILALIKIVILITQIHLLECAKCDREIDVKLPSAIEKQTYEQLINEYKTYRGVLDKLFGKRSKNIKNYSVKSLNELINKIAADIAEPPEKIVLVSKGRIIKGNKIPNSEVEVLLAGSYYHRLITRFCLDIF